MTAYKNYARGVLIGICLLIFAVATFNISVDPYAVFGAPRMAGFNNIKPFARDRSRIGKRHQVLRVAPKGLIVGNSRPAMGLSPEHSCWPAAAQPIYNIAIPGLGVYNQVRYAQHAQTGGPVRALTMGVDFVDFLYTSPPTTNPAKWPPAYADAAAETFAVDANGRPNGDFHWVRLADYVDAALSFDTLGHSLATLARQGAAVGQTLTPTGFNPGESIYRPIIRTEGPQVLFKQKNRALADRLKGAEWYLYARDEAWSDAFEALRRLIRQTRAAGTETVVFINPYHAEYLVVLDAAGLWPHFETWKRRLAELARAESVPLWDFSGFDRYSTESIDALPPRGTSLDWFWEPAHYRRELGDLMLANIWRAHCLPDRADTPPYGVRLGRGANAPIDLDAYLATQRAARDTYKTAHPDVVARIEKLFMR